MPITQDAKKSILLIFQYVKQKTGNLIIPLFYWEKGFFTLVFVT